MNTRKGFTLVELLVVIAILAILATVSVVGYTAFIENADVQAAQTELSEVQGAFEKALIMNKKVEIELGDDTVVVLTRTTDGYTVAAKGTDTTNYPDVTGIPEELIAKLTWENNKVVYTYDADSKFDVNE